MLAVQKLHQECFPAGGKRALLGQDAFGIIDQEKDWPGALFQLGQHGRDALRPGSSGGRRRRIATFGEHCSQHQVQRGFRAAGAFDGQEWHPQHMVGGRFSADEMVDQAMQFTRFTHAHWPLKDEQLPGRSLLDGLDDAGQPVLSAHQVTNFRQERPGRHPGCGRRHLLFSRQQVGLSKLIAQFGPVGVGAVLPVGFLLLDAFAGQGQKLLAVRDSPLHTRALQGSIERQQLLKGGSEFPTFEARIGGLRPACELSQHVALLDAPLIALDFEKSSKLQWRDRLLKACHQMALFSHIACCSLAQYAPVLQAAEHELS
jgi:hypothetical protein